MAVFRYQNLEKQRMDVAESFDDFYYEWHNTLSHLISIRPETKRALELGALRRQFGEILYPYFLKKDLLETIKGSTKNEEAIERLEFWANRFFIYNMSIELKDSLRGKIIFNTGFGLILTFLGILGTFVPTLGCPDALKMLVTGLYVVAVSIYLFRNIVLIREFFPKT